MSSFRVVVDLVCVGSLSSYVVTGDQAGDSQDVHIGGLGGTGPTSKPHQTLNYPTNYSFHNMTLTVSISLRLFTEHTEIYDESKHMVKYKERRRAMQG